MAAARKNVPPVVEQAARRFFAGLLQIGNRAIASAAKSASKDVKKVVQQVETQIDTVIEGLNEIIPDDASEQDDEIKAEVVDADPPRRRRR